MERGCQPGAAGAPGGSLRSSARGIPPAAAAAPPRARGHGRGEPRAGRAEGPQDCGKAPPGAALRQGKEGSRGRPRRRAAGRGEGSRRGSLGLRAGCSGVPQGCRGEGSARSAKGALRSPRPCSHRQLWGLILQPAAIKAAKRGGVFLLALREGRARMRCTWRFVVLVFPARGRRKAWT